MGGTSLKGYLTYTSRIDTFVMSSSVTSIPSSSKSPSSAITTERILSISNHLKANPNPQKTGQDDKMAASGVPYKFQGWMGLDKNSDKGNMVWQEFEPKTWTEDDVDIKITHCGICGSDIHTLRSGWVGDFDFCLLIKCLGN